VPAWSICRPTAQISIRLSRPLPKLKALLRKLAARTVNALRDALGDILARFTSQECVNYLANAGIRSRVGLNHNDGCG
jgi:hypothetical protein